MNENSYKVVLPAPKERHNAVAGAKASTALAQMRRHLDHLGAASTNGYLRNRIGD